MKLAQNIFKLSCILSLAFMWQNVLAQTPKEIEIALKFAPIFDIKICDSYTLSYFINETDEKGIPIYNNGILTQTTTNKKVIKKSLYNQRTTPLLNVTLKKDSLITETVQVIDSIHKYNKEKHQIEVTNNNRLYGKTFIGTFNIKKIPTHLRDTIARSIINVTKSKNGSTIMEWVQNDQKHQIIDSSKVKMPLYSEENIEFYNYNSDDQLTLTDNTTIGYYNSLNEARNEGKVRTVKHKDLPFNTGEIKIRYGSIYKNNIFLLEFIINKIDYQIIYTTDQQNQLLSFTYYKHSPDNYKIAENVVAYCDTFQFVANAVIKCN